MTTSKYALKAGVLLQAFSNAQKTCTNDTLTDELAEWHLKNNPQCRKYFSVIPGTASVPGKITRPRRKGGPTIIIPPVKPAENKSPDWLARKILLREADKLKIDPKGLSNEELAGHIEKEMAVIAVAEKLENTKNQLRDKGIKFHPKTGIVKLQKLLNAST